MRLTCPNCGAQYEVESGMIPADGRDVQCSNCGKTWFQEAEPEPARRPVLREPVPEEPEVTADPAPEEPVSEDVTETAAEQVEPDDVPEVSEPEVTEEDTEQEAIDTPLQDPTPRKPSEQLDEAVLGILKEEAEREVQARREDEAIALETQPDLGLDAGLDVDAASQAPDPYDDVGETDEDAELAGSRSEMLPDIEEINDSLRPADEHEEMHEVEDPVVSEKRERKGFRRGFSLVLLLVAILVAIYVFSGAIAQQVPATQKYLIIYVEAADGVRDQLDVWVGMAADAMSSGDTE